MALFDHYDRQIPDYHGEMYRDGYTPQQILHALHRKMTQNKEAEQNEVWNVKITSEVKIK